MLALLMNHVQHDRICAIISGANPYPFKRDQHGGSSLAGPRAGVDFCRAACRHVRACGLA
jgi:hypothetical protein